MTDSLSVTFVYTNSYDGTTDLLISRLGPDSVFRFNFDLWRDYDIRIGPADFEISNPSGRRLRSESVAKAYWRKPCRTRELFPDQVHLPEDQYVEEELWYALRDLVNLFWSQGKLVLTEPRAEERAGKLVQMRLAARFFSVPPWAMVRGGDGSMAGVGDRVVKSLTLERVSKASVIYTTRLGERGLDPAFPWFVQEYVHAQTDVTVVYVRGDLFAFELPRDAFIDRTADWRQAAFEPGAEQWKPHALPPTVGKSIRALMGLLKLDYGRLDFLLHAGEYAFLEVNPNGEWGWLDVDGRYGLLERILLEVAPTTALHPIPMTPGFIAEA